MADVLDLIMSVPAVWGGLGAFIYAGPRWLACSVPQQRVPIRCTLEAAVCIAIGAIAAQAFAGWALAFLHQRPADLSAVAAMIGLLANPIAPRLVEGLSTAASAAITARLGKKIKGEDDK